MRSPSPSRPHLAGLLAGLFLAAALCFAAVVLSRTWLHLRESNVVTVTGSARKNIRSDLVVWTGVLQVEASSLAAAHDQFKRDQQKVREFLARRGQETIALSPLQIQDVRKRGKGDDGEGAGERIGYRLVQEVRISSGDVAGVPRLATETLELVEQGVTLTTHSVEFLYTGLGETKVAMMAEATEDARRRADEIATRGGRQLRELRSAKMGVIQVNPLHGTSTSWEGNNDTSTLEKTVMATITAEFTLR